METPAIFVLCYVFGIMLVGTLSLHYRKNFLLCTSIYFFVVISLAFLI